MVSIQNNSADELPVRDPYIRQSRITNVVDGDTVDADIDLGFYTTTLHRLRLLRVNTPELHASDPEIRAKAQEAKAFTTQWVIDHVHDPAATWPYLLHTEKSDVFGRYLAEVYCLEDHNLSDALLAAGNPPFSPSKNPPT